jgi:hypothetical protein
MAPQMLVAIGVSIGAAMFRLVPGAAALVGMDPDSAYHVGQVVGMLLLFRAVLGTRELATAVPTSSSAGPQPM